MTAQSSIPLKWYVPFAQGDSSRVEIPVTTSDPTRASQTLGFPPLTMQPPESGGVPPQGEDFNGGMNQIARICWWILNGGGWPYDSVFASNSNINGYPNGAVLQAADFRGNWICTSDNNQNNPDTNGTNWVPGFQYGNTSISQTGGTTTLTPLQAAKNVIIVAGTLTSNLIVVVPTWTKTWDVFNVTSGAFTVVIKTAAGSGVTIPQNGAPTRVRGDGTNIIQDPANIAAATSPTHAVQFGQIGHGQCRLSVTSTTVLTLAPFNGNNVLVNGIPLTLPAAGVTVTNSGLTASTTYYVYLGGTTATPSLTLSTTGHSTATNGVETQTGNTALTLVGMIRTDGSTHFVDAAATRFCLNWFQRRTLVADAVISGPFNITSMTIIEASSTLRAQFLNWADDVPQAVFIGLMTLSAGPPSATQLAYQLFSDGIASGYSPALIQSITATYNEVMSSYGALGLAEGYHYTTLGVTVGTNGGTIALTNMQNAVRIYG